VTTLASDVFGNLTEKPKAIDDHTHVTVYGYDEADLLTSITAVRTT
jgi:YD repeat-containing protein